MKFKWIIEATDEEIKTILRACKICNIHELGFKKVIE